VTARVVDCPTNRHARRNASPRSAGAPPRTVATASCAGPLRVTQQGMVALTVPLGSMIFVLASGPVLSDEQVEMMISS